MLYVSKIGLDFGYFNFRPQACQSPMDDLAITDAETTKEPSERGHGHPSGHETSMPGRE